MHMLQRLKYFVLFASIAFLTGACANSVNSQNGVPEPKESKSTLSAKDLENRLKSKKENDFGKTPCTVFLDITQDTFVVLEGNNPKEYWETLYGISNIGKNSETLKVAQSFENMSRLIESNQQSSSDSFTSKVFFDVWDACRQAGFSQ
jgi:hypothetical protein